MRVLARIKPENGGGVIESLDGSRLARLRFGNVADPELMPETRDSPIVCWSGWLGEADSAEGWFERVPRQWLPSSRAVWDRVAQSADRARLILRPHARHLLSDGPGCLNYLRGGEERRLLLDPVAMLEPEMLPDADDHVRRMLVTLGPLAWGLVVSDVTVRESPNRGPWCVPAPAGSGSLDMTRFLAFVGEFVPAACVLVGPSEADVAWLQTLEM